LNLGPALPNGSQIQIWNGATFNVINKLGSGNWSSDASIAVGQGFFVKPSITGLPGGTTNVVWTQTLQ